jgi:hypothetical protein
MKKNSAKTSNISGIVINEKLRNNFKIFPMLNLFLAVAKSEYILILHNKQPMKNMFW